MEKKPLTEAYLFARIGDPTHRSYIRGLRPRAMVALQYLTGTRIGEIFHKDTEFYVGKPKKADFDPASPPANPKEGVRIVGPYSKVKVTLPVDREGLRWASIEDCDTHLLIRVKNLKNKTKPFKTAIVPGRWPDAKKPQKWSWERWEATKRLEQAALKVVQDWLAHERKRGRGKPGDFVFTAPGGIGQATSWRSALSTIKRHLGRESHSLRHARVKHLEDRINMKQAVEMFGWRDAKMLIMVYWAATPEETAETLVGGDD